VDQSQKRFHEAYQAAGGRVLVKANVSEILVDRGRAVGVKVEGKGGVEVRASGGVISSIGARGTLGLLEGSAVEAAGKIPWAKCVREEVSDGISHMSCFVGLDGTTESLDLRSSNQWVLQACKGNESPDLEGMCEKYYKGGIETLGNGDGTMFFMGFPSAKDPLSQEKHPGKSTCVIISEAQRDWFEAWKDAKSGRRGAEYNELKNKWKAKMIECMHKFFPKTRGRVLFSEIGSPLSNEHYLGRAASCGLEPSKARFTVSGMAALRPTVSAVPGLFLAGQDVATAGWAGALSSGMMTAMAVLGYGFLDLVVFKRNLIDDLMNLPPLEAPMAVTES